MFKKTFRSVVYVICSLYVKYRKPMFITNILLHLSHPHLISNVLQSKNDRVPSCLVFDKKVLITAMHVLYILFSSVQFSHSVVSNSLRPHELQHPRPPCPSPTPGVYPNPCPLSWWCHPTISSFVVPFGSCLQSFPASGSFPVCQFFASGGQIIGVSASTSVLPMNTQDWSPLGWTDWISLKSKGLSRVFSNTTVQKHQFFGTQLSLWYNSHIHIWLLEKP